MKIKKLTFLGLIMMGLFVATASANAATQSVSGNTSSGENQPGWLFNRDTNTQTPYEFNLDQNSGGEGSLFVHPIGSNPADKFIGELFLLTPISNITNISYDFRLGDGVAASNAAHFYMNVYANFGESSPTKFYDCRYNVVPSVGSNGAFTTVTFNPSLVYPVNTRTGPQASPHTCPASPAGMDALSTGSSTIRAIALNVGDTSSSDTGVSGYLDNVVVTKTSGVETYDFEPGVTINLLGPDPFTGFRYVEPGATATYANGEDATHRIASTSPDMTLPGTYEVVYTVSDNHGNVLDEERRTVHIVASGGGNPGNGGNRGNSEGAASPQAATATLNAGVVLPPPAIPVVLGAFTESERQAQIATVKVQLRSLITQLIGLLQAQLAAAVQAGNR